MSRSDTGVTNNNGWLKDRLECKENCNQVLANLEIVTCGYVHRCWL